MSFGFGIGDILTVAKLAKEIRKDFIAAPVECKSITDEVRNLSSVLGDVEIVFDYIIQNQKTQLEAAVRGCEDVLNKIATIIDKNSDLPAPNAIPDDAGLKSASRGRITRNAKRVWKRFRWDSGEIASLRGQLISSISALNTSLAVVTSQATFAVKDGVDRLNQQRDNEARDKLLEWLSPINYGAEQTDFVSRRQDGTAQWFLDSLEYQGWLQEAKQTLFCPGIPGAGKTILSSVVVDELTTRYGNDSTVGIAFLYCNFRRTHEQNITDLVASLLEQLVNGLPSVPNSVVALRDKHLNKRTRPTLQELTKHLLEVASMYPRAFVVVDALDECQTTNACRATLIEVIFDLQAKCGANIFATSRFIPEITETFKKCTTLEIRASRADIESFLDGNISKLSASSDWDSSIRDLIKTTIAEVVDGMFLLAQLYLQSLDDKTKPRTVKEALKGLQRQSPRASDAQRNDLLCLAYEDAMKRINEQRLGFRELAIRVLFWITLSEVPMKVLDLQYALSIEHGDTSFAEDNIESVNRMLSVCAGLVTVDPESDVIRLVHYTTQEYFERTSNIWFPPDAQSQMAGVCMTYLSFEHLPPSQIHTNSLLLNALFFLYAPFFQYASLNWGHHARKASGMCPGAIGFFQNRDAMMRIGKVLNRFLGRDSYPFIRYVDRDDSYTQAMATHMATYYGVESAVHHLLYSGADFGSKDEHGRTPLTWAASEGYTTIVKLLVDSGKVMLDSYDKDGDKHTKSPLSYAAERGREAIVQLLLSRGVNPDWRDEYKTTPLSYAAEAGHEAVARLLLARGDVTLNSSDRYRKTPLTKAAERGHESVVRLLLDREDVSPDWRDEHNTTPLAYAAEGGHEAVVRLFLSRDDVMPDWPDINGRTPISKAAERGHEVIVGLLLACDGVNPVSQCKKGRTPLSYAAQAGMTAVVQQLICSGRVDPSIVDNDHMAPLHYAVLREHEHIVRLILGLDGIDASKPNKEGWAPIMIAAMVGSYDIVSLLLKRIEVRSTLKSVGGQKAIRLALSRENVSIADLIREAIVSHD